MQVNSPATLAPLDRARQELKIETAADITDAGNAALLAALRFVTERIGSDPRLQAPFLPIKATRYFTARDIGDGGDVDGHTLRLDRPLLEATTVTNGDGEVLDPSLYRLLPASDTPYFRIRLDPAGTRYWSTTADGDPVDAISVLGIWAYRTGYASAYRSSGDSVQNNPLSDSATSITVASAAGADAWGITPRFSPGQLLKIENELLPLVGVSSNTLTVVRGGHGTTAAAHNQNTAISVWTVEPSVERAALRWGGYLYKRRGNYVQTEFDGVATTTFPPDMPKDVEEELKLFFRKQRIRRV